MKLPKQLTTVTPFSKILFAVLFITLPFLGFWLGMEYEKATLPTGYYQELRKQCNKNDNLMTTFYKRIGKISGCCEASIDSMEAGRYKLAENGTCPTGFTLNSLLCIDSYKWCESAASPTPTPNQTAEWKTYRNEKYGFEFEYPTSWFTQSTNVEEGGYINFFLEGTVPYLTNNDKSGNEVLRILIYGDENVFEGLKQVVPAPTNTLVGGKQALKNNDQIDILIGTTEKKVLHLDIGEVRQSILGYILSTFRFGTMGDRYQTLEGCEQQTGDKCFPAGSVMLTGTVLGNKEEKDSSDINIDRYLLIRTKDGIQRKIVYYHSSMYEACVTENSDTGQAITVGQTVEVLGDPTDDAHIEIWTCFSNDYYVKVLE
ncbi:hypothetical protein COV24_03710 [candidate division WWE3 bacterium CG10_big_fil_rev_8_21_14_0_10_32_10]|uniref:Uncharacterized protein n=1 Tax=candidate division WWE3 bacterium CG10_big_fil_rev_8_21_14_0_10_32_10 TaxID=1975090 RepID=A0A2H0R9M4_UNCKA|nr:MAG: hypothetical protein COV24_03710 [candidate division WWE3 bacterium CG10_big_fil_rev_8_21_14_0_10_32_10]